jgi:uncharacterized protein YutE (UPF0331/DUF86 family)
MTIDRERFEKLIGSIRDSVGLLTDLKGLSEPEFLADRHKQGSAKYNFVAAIEAVIDVANHVISKKGLRAPEDYADTFEVLRQAGALDEPFARDLMKMARFRNRLVHLYWDVDPRELRAILQTRLDDFERFIARLVAYVNAN